MNTSPLLAPRSQAIPSYFYTNEKGFTMIELLLVFAGVMILMSILFFGAHAYQEGINKGACQVNQHQVQSAVRSFAAMNNKNIGDPLDSSDFMGLSTDSLMQIPQCRSTSTPYTFGTTVPEQGVSYTSCEVPGHNVTNTSSW